MFQLKQVGLKNPGYPSLWRFSLDITRTNRDVNKNLFDNIGILECARQLVTENQDPKRFQIHFGKLTLAMEYGPAENVFTITLAISLAQVP